jgi:predicted GNAT family acetyltransferase
VPGASALRLERPGDPTQFEKIAGTFLSAREAENNLALGLTSALKAGRSYGPAVYFGAVREDDGVVGVAMRAGLYLIVTAGTSDDALRLLIDDAVIATADAPGIVGPTDLARRAVQLWTARTRQSARVTMNERIYVLSRVIPPRPAPGHMRVTRPTDLDVVAEWFHAFGIEAQPHLATSAVDARANAEGWIARGGLRMWEDGGTAVSMAGASGPTPNGIRVGAVYTPPATRRRGYASALVAALSQEQLDRGRRFCFLYTDLANPTSNKIYHEIGYEPVIDVDEYRFVGVPLPR